MNTITCIAVDDEPLALIQMQDFISRIPNLRLMAAFGKGLEALAFLQSNKPQLVFLDIQMDDISGIQMLEAMKAGPLVILTTAYENYAIKGYELDVCDYLLKPISFERMVKAVQKAGSLISAREEFERRVQLPPAPAKEPVPPSAAADHVYIRSDYRIVRVNLKEIRFIEGCKDYLKIHTDGKPVMTLISFSKMESLLPADEFVRIHRSFMVPVRRISSIGKRWVMVGEKKIPIGEFYRKNFFTTLEKLERSLPQ
jgi:DNA-binding LytR/AlgR family response regulator